MTSNTFTWGQPSGRRRATFIPSPAAAIDRRRAVAVVGAAVAVSAAAVGVLAPFIF